MNLITTREAAKRLYTTEYTIRKYIRQGKMVAAKLGKQYLIEEDELKRLWVRLVGQAPTLEK